MEGVLLLTAVIVSRVPVYLSSPHVLLNFLVLSLLVASAVFTYNVSLKVAGASLTAVVSSFSGLFAIGFQLLGSYLAPSIQFIFPPSLVFATAGGFLAVAGVYFINRRVALQSVDS